VPRLEKNGVAQPNEVIDAERPAERGICHQFWPLIARNQRSSQAPAGRRESPANNFMTLNLDEVKKQLAEQIELANKFWLDSEPQRMAADSAMKPWHETNRRIDGLKGLVSILETEANVALENAKEDF
jgi:hypothetical protein